jgi:hypothetical protein
MLRQAIGGAVRFLQGDVGGQELDAGASQDGPRGKGHEKRQRLAIVISGTDVAIHYQTATAVPSMTQEHQNTVQH